mmetsp:Transcript_17557/g.57386  ORF Transcript_17557/g.57386 Transcript_17557/m.57386 type:complete len:399 (-) Transcript_17557:99-1295(-)
METLRTGTCVPPAATTTLDKLWDGGYDAHGLRSGHGVYTFPNRFFTYAGEMVAGQRNGNGVLSMADGGSYEGSFVNDEIEGQGLRRWANGASFAGSFSAGEMHGEGVYIGADGSRYEGGFEANLRSGQGRLTLANGDEHEGTFAQNKPNGPGSLVTAGGDKYAGDFIAGALSGHGTFASAAGDTYEGAWVNGTRAGAGKGYSAVTGVSFEGTWVGGTPEPAELPTTLAVATVFEEGATEFTVNAGKTLSPIVVEALVPPPPSEDAEEPSEGADAPEEEAEPPKPTVAAHESGRVISAALFVGAVELKEDEPPVFGDPAPAPLAGTTTARTAAGAAVFDALEVPEELEPGLYTLVVSDATHEPVAPCALAYVPVKVLPPEPKPDDDAESPKAKSNSPKK